jgi:(p)ppGpp synthase/HD superfamily hydrolase
MNDPEKEPAELLTQWVAEKHSGQTKKYTGDPYFMHLDAVAAIAKPATLMGYEIGLCHDILEDTKVTRNELFEALLEFGYTDMEANYITVRVVELTDVFKSSAYPGLSRIERKENEARRLTTISPGAQTVKYCDLIYNMPLVIRYDKEHALEYLRKKKLLLAGMVDGDRELRLRAIEIIEEGLLFAAEL